mmetsp:Transcript_15665/g.27472  ORF Transcript_15665/g.27472 Transcript_15665/m.27472 type:complete len:80 (-) Transcript_15665:1069-1308(-)
MYIFLIFKHDTLPFAFLTAFIPRLHVNDSGQFLNTIEQQITLLDRVLVDRIPRIRSCGLDDSAHFINLAIQPSCSDESA